MTEDREVAIRINDDYCSKCKTCYSICVTDAIIVENIGDTRVISMPSVKMEFKLRKYKTCGNYWAPEKQIEYIARTSGTPLSDYDACPDCRE